MENCTAGVLVEGLVDLNETFLDAEASEDVAEAIVPHTLSKAFLKSMKLCRCFSMRTLQLNICSIALRPALKPACSSASSPSAFAFRLRITRNITLLGCLTRLVVL